MSEFDETALPCQTCEEKEEELRRFAEIIERAKRLCGGVCNVPKDTPDESKPMTFQDLQAFALIEDYKKRTA
jgi:hypothetical protein